MKLDSLQTVIYKLEQITLDSLNLGDIYEWSASALSHIGAKVSQELKNTDPPLEIKNFRATLPCDFHSFLRFTSVNDFKTPVLPLIEEDVPHYLETINLRSNPILFGLHDPDVNLPVGVYNGLKQGYNPWLTPEDTLTTNSNLDYRFENNSILFNIEEGTITMQYWGIPLDDKGVPLIPDNESFKEALMWFCLKQLSYQGYKFKNPDFTTGFLEAKWKFYCLQARAESQMPDIHGLQRMVNERMRLLPIDNHYYTSFKYLGVQQQTNRHGKY